jgi:hypothetical protein
MPTWLNILASSCAVAVTLAAALRWLHRWFSRLEHAVAVVEKRSQQLEPNGGLSIRDDITVIRSVLAAHGEQLKALDARMDQLAAPTAAPEE